MNIGIGVVKFLVEICILLGVFWVVFNNYMVVVVKKVVCYNVVLNNLLFGMHHMVGIFDGFNWCVEVNGISYDVEVDWFVWEWWIFVGGFGDVDDFGVFCALLCS